MTPMPTPSTLRPLRRPAALALVACLATALPAVAGEVEVRFVEPAKFTDIGMNARDRENNLQTLADSLKAMGKLLPEGQTLQIELTDIDLAGSIEPFTWGRFNDVRVLRGRADWPHLRLRYSLQGEGRTLKSGSEHLADMAYLHSMRGQQLGHESLAHEKRLLRRWFDETFLAR